MFTLPGEGSLIELHWVFGVVGSLCQLLLGGR